MSHKGAIIGFGGMAGYHIKSLEDYGRLEYKGVYDVNPERGKCAETLGMKAYSSKEELLSDDEIDVVLVATSNEVHKELVIEALSRGKNVICEKPVAMNSEEIIEMTAAAKKYGRVFTIDHNRRTNKDYMLMRRNVEAGKIGKEYIIESHVEGSRGMPSGWRTIKSLGGGMMLDWGVHLIDQMLYMYTECKVTNVYCEMRSIQYKEVEDNFWMSMTFDNNVTAHISVATNNYVTSPRWYVLGTKGTLIINEWDCNGKIVTNADGDTKWEDEIVYTKAGPTKTMAPRGENTTKTETISEPQDIVDSLTVVYDQFIDAIEGKAELTIKPEQALRVMKVMEAAFESAEKGEGVRTNI